MISKFTAEELAKFHKDLQGVPLQSDSQLEDSFLQRQTKRHQAEMSHMRTQKNWSILQELQKNVKEEDDMMTEYQKQRDDLHRITSNEQKNVIDNHLINAIKQKVATSANQSHLALADQQYNQSLLTQTPPPEQPLANNASFVKKNKTPQRNIRQEETMILNRKLDQANQERQYMTMEQEDKLSLKYQMHCLSELFKDRFLRPHFPQPARKDQPVQVSFSKLPPSFVRLVPQVVSEETVLPKNSPEIALKFIKQMKKRPLKPSSVVEVKVNPKKVIKEALKFQEIQKGPKKEDEKQFPLEKILNDYLKRIEDLVGEVQNIAGQYHPKFLRYLQEQQKNVNYELQEVTGPERCLANIASFQNTEQIFQLKLSLQKMTSLRGLQHFKKLQQAQFQFNLISSLQPIQNCTKLIQLNLSYNKINNLKPLAPLAWLRLLNIQHNSLTHLLPQCQSLEVLYAGHNRIEEININSLSQLRVLQLQYNRLHELPSLKLLGLQELNLAHNQLSTTAGTQQLILLKKLNYQNNRIQILPRLTFLFLNELNLSHNKLSQISTLFLPCLQELTLSNNKLTNKGNGIAFLPNLKMINVDDNQLQGFGCIHWLLKFSKGAQYIRYGNNEYFLSLREKVRQVYQALCYKYFPSLKVLNDTQADSGMAQFYHQNYSIYFHQPMVLDPGPSITTTSNIIRLLLRESTFSRTLQTKSDPFTRQQAYIDYQWRSKVASLKEVLSLNQNNYKPLALLPTLFYRYDSHQVARRNLSHLLRGVVLKRALRRRRKTKHFQQLRPTIISFLQSFNQLFIKSQKQKSVRSFKHQLKGLNQTQAAIKIQKVWRGFVRRRMYKRLKNGAVNYDSDSEDIDTDFFNNDLQKYEFEVEGFEDFQDIFIRPEVFQKLQHRQKQNTTKQNKKEQKEQKESEEKGLMVNNFLDSRTKLKPKKEQQNAAEKMMKQWRIKDPKVLKALQFKQQKRDAVRKKELEKNMTAAERYQRFKNGGY